MDSSSIEGSITFLLNVICKNQRNVVGKALTKLKLYAGQEMFLWQLWQENGLTQSEIVERMCVQHSTVSKMLDRLEKSGLVMRRPDPEDSRITRVFLTPEGHMLEQVVYNEWSQLEAQITAQMTLEERLLLRRLLLQVNDNLSHNS